MVLRLKHHNHCHIHQYQHHRHYRTIVLILIITLSWVEQKRFGSKHLYNVIINHHYDHHHRHYHHKNRHSHYRTIVLIFIINLSWVEQKRFGSKHSSFCGRRRFFFARKQNNLQQLMHFVLDHGYGCTADLRGKQEQLFFNKLVEKKKKLSAE